VSCSTALERSGRFGDVVRTRIGSPYVVEAMMRSVEHGHGVVVGYEANGGFLTATPIASPWGGRPLAALPTRDAVLPAIGLLVLSRTRGKTLSELVAELPGRFTWSGLRRGVPTEAGRALVERFQRDGADGVSAVFGGAFGELDSMDFTDGARITFANGDIVHVRPSGNAPELRCYTESETEQRASENNARALAALEHVLRTSSTPRGLPT
jgi:phosphomannomutase